jgi:1,2-phenylacetyl-CoA epoxidase PaaB subunit
MNATVRRGRRPARLRLEPGTRRGAVIDIWRAASLLIRQHRAVSGATEINQPTTQATTKYYADCIKVTEDKYYLNDKRKKIKWKDI